MKEKIIIILCFIILILGIGLTYGNTISEIEELREEVELHNYNIQVQEQEYSLNIEKVKDNSEAIIKYLKGNSEIPDFVSIGKEDLEYFRYIIEATLRQQVEREKEYYGSDITFESLIQELDVINYQFFDKETNTFIDYYCFDGNKTVVFELIYQGGNVKESRIS